MFNKCILFFIFFMGCSQKSSKSIVNYILGNKNIGLGKTLGVYVDIICLVATNQNWLGAPFKLLNDSQ